MIEEALERRRLDSPARQRRAAVHHLMRGSGAAYVLYTVAWAAMGASDIVAVPILSRMFSTPEFGRYLLIYGLAGFVADFAAIWASSSYVRFSSMPDFRGSTGELRGLLLAATLAVAVLCAAVLALPLLAGATLFGLDSTLALASGGVYLLGLAITTFAMGDSQAAKSPGRFCLFALVRTFGGIAGGLLASLLTSPTTSAFLIGGGLAVCGTMTPYCVRVLRKARPSRDAISTLGDALGFGSGVWLQNVGAKVLRVGDRYVIGAILGTSAVAVYGSGYTVLFGCLAVLVSPLVTLLTPMAFARFDRVGAEAAAELLSRSLRLYALAGSLAVAGAIVASRLLLWLLLPGDYADQFTQVMIASIVISAVIHGGTLTMNIALAVRRRTLISAILFFVLALSNLLGNLVLVPRLGIEGAAIATVASYALLSAVTAVVVRRYLPIVLPLGTLSYGLVLIAGTTLLTGLASNHSLFVELVLTSTFLIAWLAGLVALFPDVRSLRGAAASSLTGRAGGWRLPLPSSGSRGS